MLRGLRSVCQGIQRHPVNLNINRFPPGGRRQLPPGGNFFAQNSLMLQKKSKMYFVLYNFLLFLYFRKYRLHGKTISNA